MLDDLRNDLRMDGSTASYTAWAFRKGMILPGALPSFLTALTASSGLGQDRYSPIARCVVLTALLLVFFGSDIIAASVHLPCIVDVNGTGI